TSFTSTKSSSNGYFDRIIAVLMAVCMAIINLVRSVKDLAAKRLPDKNESQHKYSTLYPDSMPKE
uniref:Uncharacterized protein n=1 Tax=Oryza glaberrima TaxID=4538 RepID=I1Q3B5_ORYGL